MDHFLSNVLSTVIAHAASRPSSTNRNPSEPESNQDTVTIILLGETGAGKSSLIELFHFWSLESPGERPSFQYVKSTSIINKENETGGSQSGSQTLQPYLYQFYLHFERRDYSVLILDTPGMGDVKGLKQDDENIMSILKFVEDTPSVNGVVLMLNGSNCRMTSRTEYILQRLYGMCPKTFQDCLYLIFSNTQLQPNFDWEKEIKVPIHKENVIPIDNLLFSPAGLNYMEQTAFVRKKIELNYQENKTILTRMFQALIKGISLRPDAYKQLRENRDKLRVKVSGILKTIHESNIITNDITKKLNDLTCTKPKRDELLQKAKMKTDRMKITQRDTSYHNTQCLTCAVVCHEKCNLQFTAVPGHDIFRDCICMKNGQCKDCNHDHSTHAHTKFIYDRQIISKPLITEDESKELKSMNDAEQIQKYMIQKLRQTLDSNLRQINDWRNELKSALQNLKDLCPYYDYKLELRCAIELLKEVKLVKGTQYNKSELEDLEEYFNKLIKDFDQAQTS